MRRMMSRGILNQSSFKKRVKASWYKQSKAKAGTQLLVSTGSHVRNASEEMGADLSQNVPKMEIS